MNGRMNVEPRRVHAEPRGIGSSALVDDIALQIDLHQIRGLHVLKQNAITIDQKRRLGTRQLLR